MKKSIIIYSFFLALSTCSLSAQQIPSDPNLRTGKLRNGLTYYIRHNDKPKDRADYYLVQKVGSVLEEENQRGLAHFLEHMAFNGSKHFPGNSMITELEKKGIKFGANINASTSYDETIYKLTNIPTTRAGIEDTALLVLHDWSGCLTLNDKDIDDERGVVREEWRLSSNGYGRAWDKVVFPTVFKGTVYADRLPIGHINVINNFKYQELRDYYKKWYRPDLQGIIIVGNINVDKTEKKLKELFNDIPAPVHPAERRFDTIPDNKEPIFITAVDKEISGVSGVVIWKLPQISAEGKATFQWFKNEQIKQVIAGLISKRFMVAREEPEAPFSYVSLNPYNNYLLSPLYASWEMGLHFQGKDKIAEAYKRTFTEIERVRRYGFHEAELDELKKSSLNMMEYLHSQDKEKLNLEYINDYIRFFLQGIPAPDEKWEYEATKKILSQLNIDTVNEYAKHALGTENMVSYIVASQQDSVFLPSRTNIIKLLEDVKSSQLEQYVYKPVSHHLLVAKPVPGKILKTEKEKFGFTKWTLSNGAKVYFKRTDYKEEDFTMRAYSKGGLSVISTGDLPSALWAGSVRFGGAGNFSYSELERAIAGKKIFLNADIHDFSESIDAGCDRKNIETFFQYAWLRLTSPRKDINEFNNWRRSSRQNFQTHNAAPYVVFKDSINDIMANYNRRNITLSRDSLAAEKVDYDKAISIFKQRFGDASRFSFYLTGNIPEDSIRRLVETYIANLPSTYKKETSQVEDGLPPKGIVNKQFTRSMITPASNIYIGYTGENIRASLQNEVLMTYLQNILTMVYTKRMREDEGGVYYTGVSGWVSRFPKPNFVFKIEYTTNPDSVKKAKLEKIVYEEINKIMNRPPDKEAVEKVRLNLLKTISEWTSKQNNNYWNYTAYEYFSFGYNRHEEYNKIVNSITPEQIRDFAKKLFIQQNIIKVEMDPEREPKAF